ncbi:hypothetical protein Y032_0137g2041 [Ancylostoma ceylanicum]|uniref:Uncharacterized protein n=1 Tax=Ancylostoma ceylanicum TaxID=53326 RepID=A0A016T513_9BILA|nr:hypothetical protein Y032_0137g2041 [Ancylostoma ceylanicum]
MAFSPLVGQGGPVAWRFSHSLTKKTCTVTFAALIGEGNAGERAAAAGATVADANERVAAAGATVADANERAAAAGATAATVADVNERAPAAKIHYR